MTDFRLQNAPQVFGRISEIHMLSQKMSLFPI